MSVSICVQKTLLRLRPACSEHEHQRGASTQHPTPFVQKQTARRQIKMDVGMAGGARYPLVEG